MGNSTSAGNFAQSCNVEVRDAPPAHYLLKIDSFSLLLESGADKYESDEFEADGYKWKMIIYPNGNGQAKRSGHISVYLTISGTSSLPSGWAVNAICTFFLLNQDSGNYRAVQAQVRCFQSFMSEWGLPKFLPRETFMEPSNGYLVDDKCVFGAEIFVIQRQAKVECLSLVKRNDSFKRQWKIHNFATLGDNWCSEEFTVGNHKWQLNLQPRGDKKNRGKSISILLVCVDSKDFDHHQKVQAICSICVKDQINWGCDRRSRYSAWFTSTKQESGYPSFMPLTELHHRDSGYIFKDCMVVEVELRVALTQRVTSLS